MPVRSVIGAGRLTLWESTGKYDSRGTKPCSHCRRRAWRKTSELVQLLYPYVQPYPQSALHTTSTAILQCKLFTADCSGLSSLWEAIALQLQHVPPARQVLCMLKHADTCLENTAVLGQSIFQTRQDMFPTHGVLITLVTFGIVIFFTSWYHFQSKPSDAFAHCLWQESIFWEWSLLI